MFIPTYNSEEARGEGIKLSIKKQREALQSTPAGWAAKPKKPLQQRCNNASEKDTTDAVENSKLTTMHILYKVLEINCNTLKLKITSAE